MQRPFPPRREPQPQPARKQATAQLPEGAEQLPVRSPTEIHLQRPRLPVPRFVLCVRGRETRAFNHCNVV